MTDAYIMVLDLKDADVVGFTRTPACINTHCPYSARNNQPNHGHFRLTGNKEGLKKLYWQIYTETEAYEKLGKLALSDEIKAVIQDEIRILFNPPPPQLWVVPGQKAA